MKRRLKATAGAKRIRSARGEHDRRTGQFRSSPCLMHEFDREETSPCGPDVRIKRIYDNRDRADGFRVLVDRIWPRGVTKEDAALDQWARELAPSVQLRKWFDHDPERWWEFRRRYRTELDKRATELDALRERASRGRVTLLYAAKDRQINHALVLQQAIRKHQT